MSPWTERFAEPVVVSLKLLLFFLLLPLLLFAPDILAASSPVSQTLKESR